MLKKRLSLKHASDSGLISAEFAIVSLGLLTLCFFVIELNTLYFSIMSLQKAAQMGARVAIVSNTAGTGLPSRNVITANGTNGVACSDASAPCSGFATVTCEGGDASCEETAMLRVLSRMRMFYGGIDEENIRISYAYAALGYAGGPIIPEVTVTLHDVAYNTGIIGRLIGTLHGPFLTLPTVSVVLMGEDLSQAGD